MTSNLAKDFEKKFQQDWMKSFPNSLCFRLHDQVSGYKVVSQNPSDYVCYAYPNFYFCELKTHKGASIPFDAIPQYERLTKYNNITGLRKGIIVWLYEKDQIFYVPISTITQLIRDGKKSVGLKAIEEGYNIIQIPSVKKRVFMDSDYSVLLNLKDGE